MERIVAIVSPRNAVDFLGKSLLFLLMLGVLNFTRDILSYSDAHDSYLNNLYEAAFVGTPFVILTLALIGHMARLQRKLAVLAATDMLTGLPNRRAFMASIEARQPDRRCDVLMMIDVDHFKRINDTFGHAVGDMCLQQLADCLRNQVRDHDLVARVGGEEFAVLLEGVAIPEALQIANRIAKGGEFDLGPSGPLVRITASVGLAPRCGDAPIDSVLQQADDALYRAKAEGRACSRVASELSLADERHSTVTGPV